MIPGSSSPPGIHLLLTLLVGSGLSPLQSPAPVQRMLSCSPWQLLRPLQVREIFLVLHPVNTNDKVFWTVYSVLCGTGPSLSSLDQRALCPQEGGYLGSDPHLLQSIAAWCPASYPYLVANLLYPGVPGCTDIQGWDTSRCALPQSPGFLGVVRALKPFVD